MKENQRIRLTKKMLKESLIRLLNKESIHKISVREICDEAQINRTTFYKYYGSPYDLLGDMENDVLTQIDNYLSNNNTSLDKSLKELVKITNFINENLDLCRILLNNNIDDEFPEKLINLPNIRQHIIHFLPECSEAESTYIFNFMISGGFNLIKSWINKEDRETSEEIATLMGKTIMKLFRE